MEKRMTIESAKEEIKAINNQMTLYMKKKKALQCFIEQETNRLMGVKSLKEEIIDLLNKIANGKGLPKKFIYEGNLYYLQKEKCYRSDDINDIFESQFIFEDLNNEVEIIEPQEHKIPEKIEICYSPDIEEEIFYEKGNKPNHYVLGDVGTKLIINKINEIIDYLEKKE